MVTSRYMVTSSSRWQEAQSKWAGLATYIDYRSAAAVTAKTPKIGYRSAVAVTANTHLVRCRPSAMTAHEHNRPGFTQRRLRAAAGPSETGLQREMIATELRCLALLHRPCETQFEGMTNVTYALLSQQTRSIFARRLIRYVWTKKTWQGA